MEHNCDNCRLRAKYDNNPKSFLGRAWRWHANWCPGWKRYIKSLPGWKMSELAERYNIEEYKV